MAMAREVYGRRTGQTGGEGRQCTMDSQSDTEKDGRSNDGRSVQMHEAAASGWSDGAAVALAAASGWSEGGLTRLRHRGDRKKRRSDGGAIRRLTQKGRHCTVLAEMVAMAG